MTPTFQQRVGRVFFGGALLFLSAAVLYVCSHRFWCPRLMCDGALVDVGTVRQGERNPCRFVIHNPGWRPLVIKDVRTGCGACLTVSQAPRHPIAAGAKGEVLAELTTDGLDGPFRRTLTVLSNDPKRPRYRLEVRGTAAASPAKG
ncbi:MAG: DUF1573 domain-containing protein [Maioricimonas sp. JB049]